MTPPAAGAVWKLQTLFFSFEWLSVGLWISLPPQTSLWNPFPPQSACFSLANWRPCGTRKGWPHQSEAAAARRTVTATYQTTGNGSNRQPGGAQPPCTRAATAVPPTYQDTINDTTPPLMNKQWKPNTEPSSATLPVYSLKWWAESVQNPGSQTPETRSHLTRKPMLKWLESGSNYISSISKISV